MFDDFTELCHCPFIGHSVTHTHQTSVRISSLLRRFTSLLPWIEKGVGQKQV